MPEIETARLRLRPFIISDFPDYHRQITSDVDVMQTLLPGKALSWQEGQLFFNRFLEHWERHSFGLWLVFDKQEGNLIGQCGLRFLEGSLEYELVYAVARAYWGKGIATEAAKASLRYGFEELKAEQIMALTAPTNFVSQRVMQKLGMKYEKNAFLYNREVVYYTISRQEWQAEDSLYSLRQKPTN
ncbi:GNAT family N-acetyltransferase [Mastigocladopsis repens]|uniref:GNAT family N-acetyltransferase n=1 Tax=Mastigocladopsis repens TaxID=221287 RepID=UPI0002EA1EF8|nr:GNAT family N-acetyltransferase [Mastigocladopsis repens]